MPPPEMDRKVEHLETGKYYRVHILERSVCYFLGTHVAKQERYLTLSVLLYISTHSCRCKVHSGDINGKQEKISTMCRTHSNSFLYCDVYCIIDHPKQEDAKKPCAERGSSVAAKKRCRQKTHQIWLIASKTSQILDLKFPATKTQFKSSNIPKLSL